MTRDRLVFDAGIALLVLALTLGMLSAGGLGEFDPDARGIDALGITLASASSLPLVLRRVAPLGCYLLVCSASTGLVALHYPNDIPIGAMTAIYSLAVAYSGVPDAHRRRLAAVAAAAYVPVTGAAYVSAYESIGLAEGMFYAAIVLTVWIAGDRTRLRRERLAELEERAEHSEHEAERERRLAAAEERTRIARELHDSAGHAINVILVQAGAARLLHERDPARSREAIAAIEEVARGTIDEIDRLVRALREDEDTEPAPADPAALDELLERYRAGGLRITTDIREPPPWLPRSVAWASYRILQEALTNAARHGPGTADVALLYGRDAVEIAVKNPLRSNGTARAGGQGIVGMRERATLLGGSLDARADGDSFHVSARIPYSESAR